MTKSFFYLVGFRDVPSFKFGVADNVKSRMAPYRTMFPGGHEFLYVFTHPNTAALEKSVQCFLIARGALMYHKDTGRPSEVAVCGPNNENIEAVLELVKRSGATAAGGAEDLLAHDCDCEEDEGSEDTGESDESFFADSGLGAEADPVIAAAADGAHTKVARAALHVIEGEFAYVDQGNKVVWFKREGDGPWSLCPNAEMRLRFEHLLAGPVADAFGEEAKKMRMVGKAREAEQLAKVEGMLNSRTYKKDIVHEMGVVCYVEKARFVTMYTPEPEDMQGSSKILEFLTLPECVVADDFGVRHRIVIEKSDGETVLRKKFAYWFERWSGEKFVNDPKSFAACGFNSPMRRVYVCMGCWKKHSSKCCSMNATRMHKSVIFNMRLMVDTI